MTNQLGLLVVAMVSAYAAWAHLAVRSCGAVLGLAEQLLK